MSLLANIIPSTFFTGLAESEWVLWLLAGGAVLLLVIGADKVVSSAAKVASALGMSKILIGATIVSLGTTSPEAAVSVNAAIGGDGAMSLGNGVGSIICDTALVFGLCCCLKPLPKDRFILRRHGWLQLGSGVLLAVIAVIAWVMAGDMSNAWIGREAGVLLLVLLAGYLYLSVRWARQHPELIPEEVLEAEFPQQATAYVKAGATTLKLLGVLVVGLAMVIMGSEFLIGSMKVIAKNHGVPPAVIAVTLVAFGTSLPELVTALASVIKGHSELLVGNVIGADILNVLFVIGASATAVPLRVEPVFYTFLLPAMLVVLVLLRIFIFLPGDRFRRWQGIPLLGAYVVFLVITVWRGGA
jgi:cation:H+ antiporter